MGPGSLRHVLCFFLVFFWGCTFNVPLVQRTTPLQERVVQGEGRPKILLMDVSGFISQKERGGGMALKKQPSLVAEVRETLQKAEKDKDLAGVILRINSPGGTVAASDIIYHDLLTFREKKQVPVYAAITGTGTSGAYYVAAAADRVFAHPGAITGSIGVIAMKLNMEGLMTKVGIEEETVQSGERKDMFSPFRPMNPEERKILQEIIDDLHGRFVDVVYAQRRESLDREELERLADGRIYTAGQARESKLLDGIGYLDETIEEMKGTLGLEEARVISYGRSGEYPATIYSSYPVGDWSLLDLTGGDKDGPSFLPGIGFLYLWLP